jgi:hypothetical protein
MKTKKHQTYVAEANKKKKQRLIVSYHVEDCFRIPEGLDLNDTTVVSSWGVKWSTLYITYQSGKEEEIQSEGWAGEFDFKRPCDERIEDDDDE